jgi:hypothetical protein
MLGVALIEMLLWWRQEWRIKARAGRRDVFSFKGVLRGPAHES